MNKEKQQYKDDQSGFTLVETLSALGVLSIIAISIFPILLRFNLWYAEASERTEAGYTLTMYADLIPEMYNQPESSEYIHISDVDESPVLFEKLSGAALVDSRLLDHFKTYISSETADDGGRMHHIFIKSKYSPTKTLAETYVYVADQDGGG